MAKVSAEQLRSLFRYEPETGFFIRIKRVGRGALDARVGTRHIAGYRQIYIAGTNYLEHRLAWLYMTGEWPKVEIDHRDGDRSNARWSNLREATDGENAFNRGAQKNNTSGFKGVSWAKTRGKWEAFIGARGRRRFLGYFDDPLQAHAAYVAAALEHHGEFARTE